MVLESLANAHTHSAKLKGRGFSKSEDELASFS